MGKKNNPKREFLDKLIKNSLQEGPLVSLYYVVAIDMLKETVSKMTDEQVVNMFGRLYSAERVRSNIETIYKHLNPEKNGEQQNRKSNT